MHGLRHFSSNSVLNGASHLKYLIYSRARPRFAQAPIYSPGFDVKERSNQPHWEAPEGKPKLLKESNNILWHDSRVEVSHSHMFQLCLEKWMEKLFYIIIKLWKNSHIQNKFILRTLRECWQQPAFAKATVGVGFYNVKRTDWKGKVIFLLFCWISDLDFTPKMSNSFLFSKFEIQICISLPY